MSPWMVVGGLLLVHVMLVILIRLRQQFDQHKGHNDRDFHCRYWWGDRGGYDLSRETCPTCNPKEGR